VNCFASPLRCFASPLRCFLRGALLRRAARYYASTMQSNPVGATHRATRYNDVFKMSNEMKREIQRDGRVREGPTGRGASLEKPFINTFFSALSVTFQHLSLQVQQSKRVARDRV
jgi:hypothetical protein